MLTEQAVVERPGPPEKPSPQELVRARRVRAAKRIVVVRGPIQAGRAEQSIPSKDCELTSTLPLLKFNKTKKSPNVSDAVVALTTKPGSESGWDEKFPQALNSRTKPSQGQNRLFSKGVNSMVICKEKSKVVAGEEGSPKAVEEASTKAKEPGIWVKKERLSFQRIAEQLSQSLYQNRLLKYIDFLFKVNYTNGVVVDPREFQNLKAQFRVFVGAGNNAELVRTCVRKRPWLKLTDCLDEANLVWTQLKCEDYIQSQPSADIGMCYEPGQEKNRCQTLEHGGFVELSWEGRKECVEMSENEYRLFSRTEVESFSAMLLKLRTKMVSIPGRIRASKKILRKMSLRELQAQRIHNHLIGGEALGDKKELFRSLRTMFQKKGLNLNERIPETYHVLGLDDAQLFAFERRFLELRRLNKEEKNIWIIKPGENSNRGAGISLVRETKEARSVVEQFMRENRSVVIQKYLDRPLLYNRRKFDIRHYVLVTAVHGRLRGYWYREGYVRTSSYEFRLDNIKNDMVHLTNDAIQKEDKSYGRYQTGNKVSYSELEKYLDKLAGAKTFETVLGKMKCIAREALQATALRLNPEHLAHSFELLGLDFMLTDDFRPWLIEFNTNPCLTTPCPLLGRVIPLLVENVFRLVVDPLLPPTSPYLSAQHHLVPEAVFEQMRFQLFFECRGWELRGTALEGEASADLRGIWEWAGE